MKSCYNKPSIFYDPLPESIAMSIEIKFTSLATDTPQRFDRWVKKAYPRVGFAVLQKWLRTGQIRVNKKRIKGDYTLQNNDIVRFPPQFIELQSPLSQTSKPTGNKKTKSLLQQAIVYDDESCVVLNKPQGLAVQGGTNLRDYIDLYLGSLLEGQEEPLRITHRLDKDTAGLLILAKTQEAARYYTKAFQSRNIEKIYHAVIVGIPKQKTGTIDLPIGKLYGADREKMSSTAEHVDPAQTDYQVMGVDREHGLSLVALRPYTGRTHQLRVHALEGLGFPILGDGKYGGKAAHPPLPEDMLPLHQDELTLHLCATGLSFKNLDGKPISLTVPIADYFVIK